MWVKLTDSGRLKILEAHLPMGVSLITCGLIMSSLRWPRFWLIATCFCLVSTSILIWVVDCVYKLCLFFIRVSTVPVHESIVGFVMVLTTIMALLIHCQLMWIVINVEWSPGSSSLIIEFRRLKRGQQLRDQAETADG